MERSSMHWEWRGELYDLPHDDRATRAVDHMLLSAHQMLASQLQRRPNLTPVQRLAVAQLEWVVHDLTGGDGPLLKRRSDYDSARQWVMAGSIASRSDRNAPDSSGNGPRSDDRTSGRTQARVEHENAAGGACLSLEWACGLLDLDVDATRAGLLALTSSPREGSWNHTNWTEAEDQLLRECWGRMSHLAAARRLHRGLDSVRHRAACLGLPGPRQLRRLSAVAA